MKKKTGIFAIVAILAALGLWIWHGRAIVAEAVYPAENVAVRLWRRLAARARAFEKSWRLADENRRLTAEVDSLMMVRADNDALLAENARLRALLDYDVAAGGTWIPAPVLSRGGAAGSPNVLRVGKGALAGVKKGAVAAVPDGLVGLVEDVSPHTATVRLLTDPSMRVSCEVETGDSSLGAVYGILCGGSSRMLSGESEATLLFVVNPLRIRHLRRDGTLPPRARIVSSGLGGVFPKGLAVGFLIDGTREDDTGLEREGEVVPAVDIPALKDVFIRREK